MSDNKQRISASISPLTLKTVYKLAAEEKRSVSQMFQILIVEALAVRFRIKHKSSVLDTKSKK